jgi:hypothetical protein
VPAGAPTAWEAAGKGRLLHFYIPTSVFESRVVKTLDADPSLISLREEGLQRDPTLENIIRSMVKKLGACNTHQEPCRDRGVARKCGSDRGRLAFLTRDWSAPLGALQHSLESVGLHRDSAGHGGQAIGSLIYIRRQTPSPWGRVP